MELRNHFSLFCLHQETQLVHAYLPLTSHILGAFVSSQIQGHKEVGSRAARLGPLTLQFLRNDGGRAGALDVGTSPASWAAGAAEAVRTPGEGRGGRVPPPGGSGSHKCRSQTEAGVR